MVAPGSHGFIVRRGLFSQNANKYLATCMEVKDNAGHARQVKKSQQY